MTKDEIIEKLLELGIFDSYEPQDSHYALLVKDGVKFSVETMNIYSNSFYMQATGKNFQITLANGFRDPYVHINTNRRKFKFTDDHNDERFYKFVKTLTEFIPAKVIESKQYRATKANAKRWEELKEQREKAIRNQIRALLGGATVEFTLSSARVGKSVIKWYVYGDHNGVSDVRYTVTNTGINTAAQAVSIAQMKRIKS